MRRCWPARPGWHHGRAGQRDARADRLAQRVRTGGSESVCDHGLSGRADHDGFVGRRTIDRSTIGLVGGFYAVSMIVKIVGRSAPGWGWLAYCSFFTPFEPQMLVAEQAEGLAAVDQRADGSFELGGLGYDSILIGLGLLVLSGRGGHLFPPRFAGPLYNGISCPCLQRARAGTTFRCTTPA